MSLHTVSVTPRHAARAISKWSSAAPVTRRCSGLLGIPRSRSAGRVLEIRPAEFACARALLCAPVASPTAPLSAHGCWPMRGQPSTHCTALLLLLLHCYCYTATATPRHRPWRLHWPNCPRAFANYTLYCTTTSHARHMSPQTGANHSCPVVLLHSCTLVLWQYIYIYNGTPCRLPSCICNNSDSACY